jgi:hypothetical protein
MADPPAKAEPFNYDATHDAIARLRRKQVFFIGGAPKSGTTWLQLLLNAHPEISCSGEGHFIDRLLPRLDQAVKQHNATIDRKNHSIFEGLDGQPLFTSGHVYYLATAAIALMLCLPAKSNAAVSVGDKTPDNVRFFPLLAGLFPSAKFIHIVRDGRDCAVSAWFHNMRIDASAFARLYPSFADFATYFADVWTTSVRHGARFASAKPNRCLALRYEDLGAHPMQVLDRICDFLGASRDPALLRSCGIAADFTRLSGGRERGSEDRGSFFRRGVSGDWRSHFDAKTEQTFRAKTEPLMSSFRYA